MYLQLFTFVIMITLCVFISVHEFSWRKVCVKRAYQNHICAQEAKVTAARMKEIVEEATQHTKVKNSASMEITPDTHFPERQRSMKTMPDLS